MLIMKNEPIMSTLTYRGLFIQSEDILRKETDQASYEVLQVHPQLPPQISNTIMFSERIFSLKDEKKSRNMVFLKIRL